MPGGIAGCAGPAFASAPGAGAGAARSSAHDLHPFVAIATASTHAIPAEPDHDALGAARDIPRVYHGGTPTIMQPMTEPPRVPKGLSRDAIILMIIAAVAGTAVVVTGYAYYLENQGTSAQMLARINARHIHPAAERYRAAHPAEPCPTTDLLPELAPLGPSAKIDPWGSPYAIVCEPDGDITVISCGPDRKEGTADDVRIPELGPDASR